MSKYEIEDFEAIKKGETSLQDVALKYGVSVKAIQMAVNRCGIYLKKRIIIIYTPYGAKKCIGIREVADELNLSQWTIKQALKGKKIKTLEDLDIKLEVIGDE